MVARVPPALAKLKRNGIEHRIGLIPLGGDVRIRQ